MAVNFKLKFLGAAQRVTGSSYLLTVLEDGEKVMTVMVDHGMFQGLDDEHYNHEPYAFDPSEIDILFLTHAHIDHSGLIPKLVDAGFEGKILATSQTIEMAELLLYDSAKIQVSKENEEMVTRIYDANSVDKTMELFESVGFGQDYQYKAEGDKNSESEPLKFRFYRAGHILGAASIRIEYKGKSILFSGDLGRRTQPIIHPYDSTPKQADYLVCESLYGGQYHNDFNETVQQLATLIDKAVGSNGNVMLPAFAVQRSQELLLILNEAMNKGLIRNNVQIIFDSPLAQKITKIYTDNNVELAGEFSKRDRLANKFYTANTVVLRNSNKTKKARKQKGNIILTGAGMCNGGKILSYFKSMIGDSNNVVAITGFQAEGTLGRELVEGAKQIQIDRNYYNVKAGIEVFRGFSAHGDHNDLTDWIATLDKSRLQKIFLIHAEVEQSNAFAQSLGNEGYQTYLPQLFEEVNL